MLKNLKLVTTFETEYFVYFQKWPKPQKSFRLSDFRFIEKWSTTFFAFLCCCTNLNAHYFSKKLYLASLELILMDRYYYHSVTMVTPLLLLPQERQFLQDIVLIMVN